MPSGQKIRSVPLYLKMLERAGRAPNTILRYRDALRYYAEYLQVPLEELHNHATTDNLMTYLDCPRMRSLSANTRRSALSAITRYMQLNGAKFDELELAVVNVRTPTTRQDKPLEIELLQRMMDLADTHMKAVITFLISTGCRAGETSQVLLSDVKGDTVTIRNEIAKGGRGGRVYLNAEAREYLDLWLKERDAWIERANKRVRQLENRGRPDKDDRLFACTYSNISQRFADLYHAVDGETTKTLNGDRGKVTAHSCRAYFRTHGAKTMGIDLVEGIMRHTGYLNAAYVRMSEEEKIRLFHEGEDVLYITRRDRRLSENALAEEKRKREKLEEKIRDLEKLVQAKDTLSAEEQRKPLTDEDRVAIARLLAEDMKKGKKT